MARPVSQQTSDIMLRGFPLSVLQCVWEEDGCYHDLWIGQQFPTGQRRQEWLDRGMQLGFFFVLEGFTGRNGRMIGGENSRKTRKLISTNHWQRKKAQGEKRQMSKDKMPRGLLCLHFPFCQSAPPSPSSLSLTQLVILQ